MERFRSEPIMLGFAAGVLVMCFVGLWAIYAMDATERPDPSPVWGVVTLVMGWAFGSSMGSARKQDDLNRMMGRPSGTPGDPLATTVENSPTTPVPVEPVPFSEPTTTGPTHPFTTTGDG